MIPPPARHHSGSTALRTAAEALIADHGSDRTLLVTGRSSYERSGAADQLVWLEERPGTVRWAETSPNTDAEELLDGLQIVRDLQPDLVIGVGGGSVMDMAKLLCAFDPSASREELLAAIRSGSPRPSRPARLLLAPTTSGSGSEATHFAVVYIGAEKFSIAGPALRPDLVALDPRFATSGTAHQRATSGLDAVSQAIESRWAAGATRRSRRYAEFALSALLPAIEPFCAGDDSMAPAMQFGSHLAGRAIDISKTTAAHALAYGITKRYGVDHGNAVALTLGHFIDLHADAANALQTAVTPESHAAAMAAIASRFGVERTSAIGAEFRDLVGRIGLPSSLDEVGLRDESEVADLVRGVNVERLGNNPVVLDDRDLATILKRAAAGPISTT